MFDIGLVELLVLPALVVVMVVAVVLVLRRR